MQEVLIYFKDRIESIATVEITPNVNIQTLKSLQITTCGISLEINGIEVSKQTITSIKDFPNEVIKSISVDCRNFIVKLLGKYNEKLYLDDNDQLNDQLNDQDITSLREFIEDQIKQLEQNVKKSSLTETHDCLVKDLENQKKELEYMDNIMDNLFTNIDKCLDINQNVQQEQNNEGLARTATANATATTTNPLLKLQLVELQKIIEWHENIELSFGIKIKNLILENQHIIKNLLKKNNFLLKHIQDNEGYQSEIQKSCL